ncbi:hypothetical protein vseg_012151 [Gypsophila vaccaria]
MGRNKERTKVETVLDLLRKQSPLTLRQEKFCNTACVERFLKAKGENVKKGAKQLRACLTWRDAIGIENLIADEFSGELAEGLAYVAGHDDESRPVMVFRIKQDYQKFHSQKLFTRLMVFTLEVAVQTMSRYVEQFVILFDASFFRSASSFMNILLPTLKIVAEYYPGRLHKAFVIDPPSLFTYLWKGVRPFVDLSNLTTIVTSSNFEEQVSLDYADFSVYPRAASLRFDPSSLPVHPSPSAKIGSSASTRFTFTVAHHFDSLKPWYLSLGGEPTSSSSSSSSTSKVGPTMTPHQLASSSPSILGPTARSFSFASPRGSVFHVGDKLLRKNFIPSTPLPQKSHNADAAEAKQPRTPRPSAFFNRREASACQVGSRGGDKSNKDGFVHYFKFYRRSYDEMVYRSKMKPPLGGLISIVAPHHLHHQRRRHMSISQRF